MDKEFCFVVGRPWKKEESENIKVYAYFHEVQYDTLEGALAFKEYVDKQTKEENFIYKLVKMEDLKEKLDTILP
jgi:hypothetical protein